MVHIFQILGQELPLALNKFEYFSIFLCAFNILYSAEMYLLSYELSDKEKWRNAKMLAIFQLNINFQKQDTNLYRGHDYS